MGRVGGAVSRKGGSQKLDVPLFSEICKLGGLTCFEHFWIQANLFLCAALKSRKFGGGILLTLLPKWSSREVYFCFCGESSDLISSWLSSQEPARLMFNKMIQHFLHLFCFCPVDLIGSLSMAAFLMSVWLYSYLLHCALINTCHYYKAV